MRKHFCTLASLLGLALLLAIALPAAAQTPPAVPDHHAFEFVGKVAQNGTVFTVSGYVTHIKGADDSVLFTGTGAAEQTEATARLTFAGTLQTIEAAAVGKQLHALAVAGTLTFYAHDQGGADFSANSGFDTGSTVATAAVRVQDVISVYAPQQGLASGAGDLAWQSSSPFSLAGQQLQLGTGGTSLRISFSGVGTLTQPTPPVATIDIAGYGVAE